MKTYFKIYVNGVNFRSRLYPHGLSQVVDDVTYQLVMSQTSVCGTHYFSYQSLKIVLVVKPLKSQNNEKEKNSSVC